MVLKFHVQDAKAAGLQNLKIQAGRESKMTALAKNSETTKISFFSRTTGWIYLAESIYRA